TGTSHARCDPVNGLSKPRASNPSGGVVPVIGEGMLMETPVATRWSALVIDDDAGIRQSLRLCLEADQARVLGVGTGRAALELLDRTRFDLVLLDLWLGPESGLTLMP